MIKSIMKVNFHEKVENIWKIVTDNQNYHWRSDLSKIDVIDETHFIEYTIKGYPTYFEIVSAIENKEYQFRMQNTNMSGNWIGIFQKIDDDTTQIVFTEEIEVEKPMMKLFAKLYLKQQQIRYMKDLKKKLKSK